MEAGPAFGLVLLGLLVGATAAFGGVRVWSAGRKRVAVASVQEQQTDSKQQQQAMQQHPVMSMDATAVVVVDNAVHNIH